MLYYIHKLKKYIITLEVIKMTREKRELAKRILEIGTFQETTGSEVYKNNFYTMPMGNLVNIQYKNGKMYDVINYGR
jgi:hypothetical protein